MGRRYYCDYCDKTLPAGITHRINHNRGVQHTNNKRAYYEQFKDPIELLLEEQSKRPCNRWIQTGSCPFGLSCKYSHRSNQDLIQLIERAQRNLNPQQDQTQIQFDVQQWIKRKLSLTEITVSESLLS